MSKPRKRRPVIPGVSVYPRGKSWSYLIELDAEELSGERQRDYKGGFASEDEAWAAAVKAHAAIEENRRVPPSKRTVTEFFDEWLKVIRDSIKPSTYANYVDYRDAYVVPKIGKRRLQDVDVQMLNTLYRRLLTSGRLKPDNNSVMYDYWRIRKLAGADPMPKEIADACKVSIHAARSAVLRYRRGRIPKPKPPGLEPKTVKNIHRMLHRALADAVSWRYLPLNPATHASLPREKRAGRRRRGSTWTTEQLTAWLRIANTDRDAAMWVW